MKISEVWGFEDVKNSYYLMLNDSINNLKGTTFAQLKDKEKLPDMAKCLFCLDMIAKLDKLGEQEADPVTMELMHKMERTREQANIHEKQAKKAYEYAIANDNNFAKDYRHKDISEEGLKAIAPKYSELVKQYEDKLNKLNTNTVNAFEKHRQSLINAKTKRNSKAYEDIIKAVEWVNNNATFDKGKDLNEVQRYVTKLLVIKNSINKYIEHKAEKGVNKNIGDKLAVVEALNVEVSNKLKDLREFVDPFTINGKDVDLRNIPISMYEERKKAYNTNPNGHLADLQDNQHATDDCMRRIIFKAVEKKYSPSHIEDLHKMRDVLDKIETSKPKMSEQPSIGGRHM